MFFNKQNTISQQIFSVKTDDAHRWHKKSIMILWVLFAVGYIYLMFHPISADVADYFMLGHEIKISFLTRVIWSFYVLYAFLLLIILPSCALYWLSYRLKNKSKWLLTLAVVFNFFIGYIFLFLYAIVDQLHNRNLTVLFTSSISGISMYAFNLSIIMFIAFDGHELLRDAFKKLYIDKIQKNQQNVSVQKVSYMWYQKVAVIISGLFILCNMYLMFDILVNRLVLAKIILWDGQYYTQQEANEKFPAF